MKKGSHHTNVAKIKIGNSKIGKSSWNKGIPFSEESKEKMRVAKLDKTMSDEFKQKRSEIMKEKWANPIFRQQMSEKKRGENNPNYHKPMPDRQKEQIRAHALNRSPEWREKQRISHTGKKDSDLTRARKSESHSGNRSYNWKGGITPLYKHIRGHRKYKEWCKEVLKKYKYTDVFTNTTGGIISCHHIIPVNILIKMYNLCTIEQALECSLIWDVNNGVAIKKLAHDKFHNIYGDRKNIYELTPDQIKELYT